MIIKVELIEETNGSKHCMMFGTSYKKWYQQLYEYLCAANRKGIRYTRYGSLEQSRAQWVKGGLKWCSCESVAAYYIERNDKDFRKINFTIPSETTLVKFEDILGEVSELNLNT